MAHLKNKAPTLSHVLDMFKNQSQPEPRRLKNTKQSQSIETDRRYAGRFLPKDKYQCLLSPTLNLFSTCLDNMQTVLSSQNNFNSHMHEEDSLVLNISVGEHDIDVNIDGKNDIDTNINADIIENNDEIKNDDNDTDTDFSRNSELFDNDNLYEIDAENRNDGENEKDDTGANGNVDENDTENEQDDTGANDNENDN